VPFGPLGQPEDDLALVEGIRSGSVEAWHSFIDRYAPLILSVIRRYLVAVSDDGRRTVFVEVLTALYRGKLDAFQPRARLSTWLFVFARNRCLDALRSERGRRAVPGWVRRLEPLDAEVYRLYYLHGCPARDVCMRLSTRGRRVSLDDLAASLSRLDGSVDDAIRQRTAFDLQARASGVISGRLLAYLHELRVEHELDADDGLPDARLLDAETARVLERLRECVDRLPALERDVIAKRYFERQSARRTAEALRLNGQRVVYSVEERALSRLRGMLRK
jgi:DNA-directed RNA polymerase specialized sigma24 family protein